MECCAALTADTGGGEPSQEAQDCERKILELATNIYSMQVRVSDIVSPGTVDDYLCKAKLDYPELFDASCPGMTATLMPDSPLMPDCDNYGSGFGTDGNDSIKCPKVDAFVSDGGPGEASAKDICDCADSTGGGSNE